MTVLRNLTRPKSIQLKIVLIAGFCLVLLAASVITYATLAAHNTATQAAQDQVLAIADTYAARVKAELEVALDESRALAQAFAGFKSQNLTLTRDQVNAMLKGILADEPQFLGTYTLWEPNAFDGNDAQYANTAMHDETGRFIPYWNRASGLIAVEPLLSYETAGMGDYYQ